VGVLVNDFDLVRILVLRFVILVFGMVRKLEHDLSLIDMLCVVRIGSVRWLTPPNLPPRGMRVVLCFKG
jgi:hypothetical protein